MFILIRVCILGSRCLQTRGSWSTHGAPLSFAIHIVAKALCFCLCLLDAIIELHAMDEKMFNDFLMVKVKVDSHVIKT